MRCFARLGLTCFLLLSWLLPVSAEQLTVFAAASLREAAEQIGTAFEAQTGTKVVFSFAGTGTLARQVAAGAPADVFLSADADWMDYVAAEDAVVKSSIEEVASNAIVLVGPEGAAPLRLSPDSLSQRLGGERLAIADPETVPAGRYGKASLKTLGLWQSVSGQLAPMENVRVALAAVARGETPLGLVYRTDAAIDPKVSEVVELPQDSHPRIRYLAARTTISTAPGATVFLSFVTGPEAHEILRSLGFVTDKIK